MKRRHLFLQWFLVALMAAQVQAQVRSLRFKATTIKEAKQWQQESRHRLFELMMGGERPAPAPLEPKISRRIEMEAGGYALEELTLQSRPDRRVHAWLAVPLKPQGKAGAALALHGHGGSGEAIVRGEGLYWYGRALAEMGYVVISPDIGSHELQHPDWSLMGERVWDALRCVDYLASRPEVDPERIAVAGLSLGGETAMYVAALDNRVKAVCSSGWLTTIENMKAGHCPCWNFAGLEAHFDFADIFACIAPRALVLEVGEKERAPGGFPVDVARKAFDEIQKVYSVFGAGQQLLLDIHPGGHVFHGAEFWPPLHRATGAPFPWSREPEKTDEALRRGEIARRAFSRALGVFDGWWAHRDLQSGLYPRRLDQPLWAPQDNAADMLPFLFLTAHFLAQDRLESLEKVMRAEKALTSRLGALPDWYSLEDSRFVHDSVDVPRLVFGAAEYCKDGLLPMTEVMGRGMWTERMFELLDAIFEHAPIQTDFGALPADDSEVNGDVLQVLGRIYAMTKEPKYLAWAERIGDAYCFEVLPKNGGLPPHRWDFKNHRALSDTLNLNDHGNELIGGLAELYAITKAFSPEKARRYKEPIRAMFYRLIEHARNEDGLWYNLMQASTAEPIRKDTPDTWGYALSAAATFGMATEDSALADAARHALRNVNKPRYLDWQGADAYADSIEGALLLLNRFPEKEGFAWLETILPIFFGKQREDGVVEGWYGDGNYARTALMVALYFTQGAHCRPWRSDLRFGAVRDGDRLLLAITAEREWSGKVFFDSPRHQLHLGLPFNYPRLNEFPEWFAVLPGASYKVIRNGGAPQNMQGAELINGLPLKVEPGEPAIIEVLATRN